MKTKDTEQSTQTVHRKYKDAQGNIHSDENGYMDSQFTKQNIQDKRESRADKNISKGIIAGVMIACIAGLSVGAIYFLTQHRNQRPIYWMNGRIGPMYERTQQLIWPSEPVQEPIEQKTYVSSPAPELTQKITPQPNIPNSSAQEESVNEAKPIVELPLNSSATNSNVSQTDKDLQTEILAQFDNNIPNHQLIVEVNNAEVIVSGTVATPEQIQKIQPLLTSIEGMGKVEITATVASQATTE